MSGTQERQIVQKATWRLLPLLTLLYLVAFIDRQNVGYAKLQMLGDLHMSEVAYGLGASLFFIGYLVFGLPSNLALSKFGARTWIAIIMFFWGCVTLALAWTTSATEFFSLRFLLGAGEAGLYPGLIFYMTLWFPDQHRIRVVGYFTLASSLGNMTGALIGGSVLSLNGLFGFHGWQLLFLATGILPICLAALTLFYLPETPERAKFLSTEEKTILLAAIAREKPISAAGASGGFWSVLLKPRIFLLAFFYMLISLSTYGISYWLPTVVKTFGVSSAVNGQLNMIPWALASLALFVIPGYIKNLKGIFRCVSIAVPFGIVCFATSVFVNIPAVRLGALALGAPCVYLMLPCFWWVPSRMFRGAQAASAIAAINALGNMGGFFGQNVMPQIQALTHNVNMPMIVPAGCLGLMGLCALLLSRHSAELETR